MDGLGLFSLCAQKTSSQDTRHWNERTDYRQRSRKSPSGGKTNERYRTESDVHLSLTDSDEDCPVLQRVTGPAGDDQPSSTDIARSKQNVSEWLTTYVDNGPTNWEKIDMISVSLYTCDFFIA